METAVNISKLEDIVRRVLSSQRKDVVKKICSRKDAMHILDVSSSSFDILLNDKDCLIRRSKLKGKYVLSSVYEEADRLNE